jgi:hypothetical protein
LFVSAEKRSLGVYNVQQIQYSFSTAPKPFQSRRNTNREPFSHFAVFLRLTSLPNPPLAFFQIVFPKAGLGEGSMLCIFSAGIIIPDVNGMIIVHSESFTGSGLAQPRVPPGGSARAGDDRAESDVLT